MKQLCNNLLIAFDSKTVYLQRKLWLHLAAEQLKNFTYTFENLLPVKRKFPSILFTAKKNADGFFHIYLR